MFKKISKFLVELVGGGERQEGRERRERPKRRKRGLGQ